MTDLKLFCAVSSAVCNARPCFHSILLQSSQLFTSTYHVIINQGQALLGYLYCCLGLDCFVIVIKEGFKKTS